MTDMDKAVEEGKAAVLPYESWERLTGESSTAYAAFCTFRDYGPERNVRRAVAAMEPDEVKQGRRYRVWSAWATAFKWRERAADYDRYLDRMKQTEGRKTIEEQGKVHRAVTGKMLEVVFKKLEMMDPADLTQGTVTEWVDTAIRAEREASNQRFDGLVVPNGNKAEPKQGEINFTPEFEGL
jgi:hypothetical protein